MSELLLQRQAISESIISYVFHPENKEIRQPGILPISSLTIPRCVPLTDIKLEQCDLISQLPSYFVAFSQVLFVEQIEFGWKW